MAEAMNYRMNLVIDPKNVIKANRELRAMERYFERIQGRVMRIGRTRMAPEIVLKDSASKGLDSLLAKMERVRSQVINASGNVKLEVAKKMDTHVQVEIIQSVGAIDYSRMLDALAANTDATIKLTSVFDKLSAGVGSSEQVSDGLWGTIRGIFGFGKASGETVRSIGETPDKWKKTKEAWRGGDIEPGSRKGKFWNRMTTTADLIETVSTGAGGLMDGIEGVWNQGKKWFGGGGGTVSSGIKGATKVLGPASIAVDAASIATASSERDRSRAIGAATVGTIGATVVGGLGSSLPVIGNIIGSALGGTAGYYIGDKIGGLTYDLGEAIKIKDWFSFGKKKTPSFEEIAKKPAILTGKSAANSTQTELPSKHVPYINVPKLPDPIVPKPSWPEKPSTLYEKLHGGPIMPASPTPSSVGGRVSEDNQLASKLPLTKDTMSSQSVKISPEQMTTLSGLLMDFKTETTVNYNLPPGAVQVTVHEEHPIDVEGLILQIGQRLRAEFSKAAQNRKPTPMAY